MQVSVYIATSVDGYIARKNGDLDWLTAANGSASSEDYGYTEFSDTVDCVVMGRNTMETVMGSRNGPIQASEWSY